MGQSSLSTYHSLHNMAETSAKTALIVDDNVDAANVLALALKHFGYQVEVAYDGSSGVAAFVTQRPRFVFLDIGMPDMSGYDVARTIRAAEKGKVPAKLVAITGFGQEKDKEDCIAAGFDCHFTKPVSLKDIQEFLKQ